MEQSKRFKLFQVANTIIFIILILWCALYSSQISFICFTGYMCLIHVMEFILKRKKKNIILAFILFLATLFLIFFYKFL